MKRAAAHWQDQWSPRPSSFLLIAARCAASATARSFRPASAWCWRERIRSRALGFAVGAASSHEIDRLNIRVARRSPCGARSRPSSGARSLDGRPYRILIDGLPLPEVGYAHDALVDGDARCQSIAAAAILAKTRATG